MKGFAKTLFKNSNTLIVPIDKLSNYLFAADITAIESIVEDKRLDIISPVRVIFPSDENGVANLTPFDKMILNVLLSVQDAGNEYISYFKLYRLLGGGKMLFNNANKMCKALDRTLWKLRCTDLTVTMTDIVSKRKKYAQKLNVPYNDEKNKKEVTIRGVVLPNEVMTTSINGKITDSTIHFLGESVIFRVADLKDQFARTDLNLLSVPIKTTQNTITLTAYLLERILKIKGSNAESKKHVTKLAKAISFDTLFRQCGLPADTRDQRQTVRRNTEKILDHFKEQNFIADYLISPSDNGDFSIEIAF